MPGPLISVVAPVFNESEHLVQLHRAVTQALDPITDHFELILADDGSQDDSAGIVERLWATDPRLGLVRCPQLASDRPVSLHESGRCFAGESFDAITLVDVIEHIYAPRPPWEQWHEPWRCSPECGRQASPCRPARSRTSASSAPVCWKENHVDEERLPTAA